MNETQSVPEARGSLRTSQPQELAEPIACMHTCRSYRSDAWSSSQPSQLAASQLGDGCSGRVGVGTPFPAAAPRGCRSSGTVYGAPRVGRGGLHSEPQRQVDPGELLITTPHSDKAAEAKPTHTHMRGRSGTHLRERGATS